MATISGTSYDNSGDPLGSCKCFLFKDNGDNTLSFIDHVVSNAVTGAYSFSGIGDMDPSYLVYFVKDDTPHVFDVTGRNVRPTDFAPE